ncbi:MAG: hypothetical protein QY322_04785 [bacterium]|nr:MAG: hypothetical protein QY322_04785 [bacterium]
MPERYSFSTIKVVKLVVAELGERLTHPINPRLVRYDEKGNIVKIVRHEQLTKIEMDWESVMNHTTGEE